MIHRLTHVLLLTAALLVAPSRSLAQDPGANAAKPAEKKARTEGQKPAESKKPADGEKPQSRTVDLSTPRSTMRELLLAIQEADAGTPGRIDDALKTLDTSKLDEKDRATIARERARRLAKLVDRIGVNISDIPEEPEDGDFIYTFYPKGDVKIEGEEKPPAIQLELDLESDVWRFNPHTLASIPAIERALDETEKPAEKTDSEVPAAYRSARATMDTFLRAFRESPIDDTAAMKALDPAPANPETWRVRGVELARKLKNVIDKIKVVVLSELPDDPAADRYVWHSEDIGSIALVRKEEGDFKGYWRFAPATIDSIDALYARYQDREILSELQELGVEEQLTFGLWLDKKAPPWMREKHLGLEGWKWAAVGVLVAFGFLLRFLSPILIGFPLRFLLRRRGIKIEKDVLRRAVRSTGTFVMLLVWYLVIRNGILPLPEAVLPILIKTLELSLAISGVWVGYRIVDVIGGHISSDKDMRLTHFDDVLIPMLRRLLRVFLFVIAVLFVIRAIKSDMPAEILGALGVGGVALAFAAQDTIGNFFGAVTVLFDRPFGIGDWIAVGDVEGTVERVGFRSTRIRTFYNSLVSVPNSKMVNTQIDNYGARQYRRNRFVLSVTYSTPPERIDAFCEGIRELIRLHPYTRKDMFHVYFNAFAGSSLDVLVYMFFDAPDWGTELREKHYLFLDVLRLADKLGVDFAFPTQTVWLERGGRAAENAELAAAFKQAERAADEVGVDLAGKVYRESYGEEPKYRPPVVIDSHPRSGGKGG